MTDPLKNSMTPPPVLGAIEVVLSVKSIPTMENFYREALGFHTHSSASLESEIHDPQGKPTIVFMTVVEVDSPLGRNGHPQMLVLIDHERHIHARKRLIGHDVSRSTLNHLAFEISAENYPAHKAYLEAQGLKPVETFFESMQAKALFFNDPEGNTLELICHVPSSDESRKATADDS